MSAFPSTGSSTAAAAPGAVRIREEAARWFARAQAGVLDEAGRADLAAWRAAAGAHDFEYQALLRVWDVAGRIAPERLLALAEEGGAEADAGPRRSPPPRVNRWRHAGAALACVLAVGVGLAVYTWRQAQPLEVAAAETARGERRSFTLPDGSSMELNTRSRAEVRYYRDRRVVALAAGEATFSVDADAARPFIVDAGRGSVRVTGTRFNVRRDGDEVAVAVLSGTVEVRGTPPEQAPPAVLSAGMAVRVDGSGQLGAARKVDVTALTAWRDGKLVFDDVPLAEVLREVARYRARPIAIADPELARLRLSSSFNTNDTDALLEALPRILPVKVRMLPDGGAEIVRP